MRRKWAGWVSGMILCVAGACGMVTAGRGERMTAAPESAAGPAPSAEVARLVYDRVRSLAGDWRGRSTKGWEDRANFQIIAGGSAVVATSRFEAHPGDTMMTIYHLDGDRMMLTHYCVAKNQPRLQVTAVENRGNRVTFSFRDGTNLASRDQGHMDRVIFEFQDEDHFASRWSFYKNGREDWMEEIHYERIR